MKVIAAFLFLVILNLAEAAGQSFYVSSPKDPLYAPGGSNIYKVTLNNGGMISELVSTCISNNQYFSIAMDKNGFYWLDSPNLRAGTLNGQALENCKVLRPLPGSSTALTISTDEKVYFVMSDLISIDTRTSELRIHGRMSYFPTGDMAFYNEGLYMMSNEGVVKIDINDPSNSYVYMPVPGYPNIFGLVSVPTARKKNTVFAFSNRNPDQTDVIELDLDNKRVVGLVGTLAYGVLDAASIVENGSIIGLEMKGVEVAQDCSDPAKGIVTVRTVAHVEEFTYTLSNGMTNSTGIFTGVSPGTYQVTVTSSQEQETAAVTVPSFGKPVYTISIKNQTCDLPGEVTFSMPVNPGSYRVRLGTLTGNFNEPFRGLSGQSSFPFEVLNSSGCVVETVDVSVPRDRCIISVPQVEVRQQCDAIHKGEVNILTGSHSQPYQFNLNGAINSTGVFRNLSPGSYTATITSPDDEIQVPVIVPDYAATQPALSSAVTDPACAVKGSIRFTINDNPALYQLLYNGNLYAFDHVFSGLGEGTYRFTLTKSGCLIDQYEAKLVYRPCAITIDAITVAPECDVPGKGSVQVSCPPIPETYSYTMDGKTNTTGLFNMLNPGSYTLTVSASGGATPQTRTVVIPDFSLNKPPVVRAIKNPVCDLPGQVSFKIGSQASAYSLRYNGQVYPSDYVFTGLYAGDYAFSVLNTDGCVLDLLTINLQQETCSPVSFPSAFTPNGDGLNDVFRPAPDSKATNFLLKIYDRWGALIYLSANQQEGWNGELKGRPVPQGTYYWFATFNTQTAVPAVLKGSVVLIR